jgi:hypothetical protein
MSNDALDASRTAGVDVERPLWIAAAEVAGGLPPLVHAHRRTANRYIPRLPPKALMPTFKELRFTGGVR